MHESALRQYVLACALVSRSPATDFAARVHEEMNALRTDGG